MLPSARSFVHAAAFCWILLTFGQALAAPHAPAMGTLLGSDAAVHASGAGAMAADVAVDAQMDPVDGTCSDGTMNAHCTSCGHCAVVVLGAAVHHPHVVRASLSVIANPLLDVPTGRQPRPPQSSLLS
jgi:hypothetical protein